jgi:two-component system, NarL family, nitrate/nitrite response regulator NarL
MAHNPVLPGSEDAGSPTRIRVVSRDKLVTDALRGVLAKVPGVEVVGETGPAHVLLWDGGSQSPAAHRSQLQALAARAIAPILALAQDDAHASQLLGAGARGAVQREASPLRLAAAAIGLRFGLCVVDADLAGPWLAPSPPPPDAELGEAGLTAREREVLALLGLGLSNKSIARRLDVSVHTVKFHVNSILGKLNADSRTAAVTAAVRRGLLSL